MRQYSLHFREGGTGSARTIAFESDTAHEAFSIAQREQLEGQIEIHEGERMLGTITRMPEGS